MRGIGGLMISQRFLDRIPSTSESLVALGEFKAFGETISDET